MYIFSFIKNFIHNLKPQTLLVLGFLLVILLGAVLLTFEFASKTSSLNFIDALFMAASATCVTGLAVVDIGTTLSFAGQIIILLLIQIGGLGVMTFSTFLLLLIRGRFGIASRELIQETLTYFDNIEIASLLKTVFSFAFVTEFIGAVLLSIRFAFDMPLTDAIYSGIFHSISAFCNAGFSIYSDSLMKYQSDVFVNFVFIGLIILGGIGFIVAFEVKNQFKKKLSWHNFSLHSKIVLSFTPILIIAGFFFIFFLEFNHSMKELDFGTKILASLFQSVTSRTAGFNTVDISNISISSIVIISMLMFIGASSASCGGGIKTSTFVVVLSYIKARINSSNNVNLFYSSIPQNIVVKSILIFSFSFFTIVLFSFLLAVVELQGGSLYEEGTIYIQLVFETVSAFGTVGLSTGITPSLSDIGKLLVSVLMFIGRLGPITIALVMGTKENIEIKYAEDKIIVG